MVVGPRKLEFPDQNAITLAGAGFLQRLFNATHFQYSRETFIAFKVIPVGHLTESFNRGASDDERVRGIFDGKIFNARTVCRSFRSRLFNLERLFAL